MLPIIAIRNSNQFVNNKLLSILAINSQIFSEMSDRNKKNEFNEAIIVRNNLLVFRYFDQANYILVYIHIISNINI